MSAPAVAGEVLERLKHEFERRSAPFDFKPSALLSLLHAVQEAYGYVPPAGEAAVAEFLGMGANRVHEAVTFYTLYRQHPYGKYHVQVCRTLACDLCGWHDLVKTLMDRFKVAPRTATADGLFSWETVECLGCCDLAPALQINKEPFRGPMTAGDLGRILDDLAAKEKGNGHG